MTIQYITENATGSLESPNLTYFIYDDGDPPASLTDTQVLTYALAISPPTKNGVTRANLAYEQLANHAWRVTVPYSDRSAGRLTPTPPPIGDERVTFNFSLRPRTVTWAKEMSRYPASGDRRAPDSKGLVNIQPNGLASPKAYGVTMPVPTENLAKRKIVSVATAEMWAPTVAQLVGCFNDQTIGAYKPGELLFTSFRGHQRNDDEYELALGWAYKANVTNETWGAITGVTYRGHDYVYTFTESIVDRDQDTLYDSPLFVYVHQIWQPGNLYAIGVMPP